MDKFARLMQPSAFSNVSIIFLFILISCGNSGHEQTKGTKAFGQPFVYSANDTVYYFDTVERTRSSFYSTSSNNVLHQEPYSEPKSAFKKNAPSGDNKSVFLFSEQEKDKGKLKFSKTWLINKQVPVKDGIHRFRRQIPPLWETRTVKSSKSSETRNPEVARLQELYTDFLIDYALAREWRSAEMIVPDQAQANFCQDFTMNLLLSKAFLALRCMNESQFSARTNHNWKSNHAHKNPTIIADFARPITTSMHNTNSFITPHVLFNYSRSGRSAIMFAGAESLAGIQDRIMQPEQALTNYKWTLVKVSEGALHQSEGHLEIYDVFGFATSLTPLLHKIGSWSGVEQLSMQGDIRNFHGHLIRVTTVPGPPFVNPPTSLSAKGLNVTGYLPDILEMLGLFLNFKYIISTPSDGKFGNLDQYGNWTGMVGMLLQNEADIAVMSFSYTKSRKTVMDFSPPVEYSSTRLLIRRDRQAAELKFDAFIRPFEWQVWIAIVFLIGMGALTLIIFSNFRLFTASLGESVWVLSTMFLLQGHNEHTTVTPYRIATGSFWMLAVFMYACYTARLTSFLAADTEKLPVSGLNQAVQSRSWKIGLVKGSSFMEKVKESNSVEMTRLWKRLQEDEASTHVDGFQDGIAKVYREGFIFFTSDLIPTYMVKGNCSYAWLPGKYFPGFGYMGYQKNLPYSSTISNTVTKIREAGLMRRTIKKWWGTATTCGRQGADAFVAISLQETGSAFLVLMIGASLAILFTTFEFITSAVKRESERNMDNTILRPYSSKEYAAPVVHGAVENLLPVLLRRDKPFVWSVEDKSLQLPRLVYVEQL